MFYCITCTIFVYLRMIRINNNYKQKEGFMNQEMKQAILSSADLLKEGDFDGIRDQVETIIT
mgnify:CR=1 FL=1